MHWNRLPRDIVESVFLDILRTIWMQSSVMSSRMTLLEQGGWIRWPTVGLSYHTQSLILWFWAPATREWHTISWGYSWKSWWAKRAWHSRTGGIARKERSYWLRVKAASWYVCCLTREKKITYYLELASREWTLYIIFIGISLFSKKIGLLSSCSQVRKITSLSVRKFSLIFLNFCLGSQAGVLLMTPWPLKPPLVSNQVLAIGFTYRENACQVLFLWKQQKWVTLWVRNVQFCSSVEAFVQILLPLLPSGFFMPISLSLRKV